MNDLEKLYRCMTLLGNACASIEQLLYFLKLDPNLKLVYEYQLMKFKELEKEIHKVVYDDAKE